MAADLRNRQLDRVYPAGHCPGMEFRRTGGPDHPDNPAGDVAGGLYRHSPGQGPGTDGCADPPRAAQRHAACADPVFHFDFAID